MCLRINLFKYFICTLGNHFEIVQMLLEYKPNVNALDKDGYTALAIACKEGYYDIALSLINSGAYINVQVYYKIAFVFYQLRHKTVFNFHNSTCSWTLLHIFLKNSPHLLSFDDHPKFLYCMFDLFVIHL